MTTQKTPRPESRGHATAGEAVPTSLPAPPRSCRDYTDGPLCTADNRCPAHRGDPERLGDILRRWRS